MITYVVTEGKCDVELLKKLLPAEVMGGVKIVEASGSYSAQSLARSIVASTQCPVALVVDADTVDELAIQERRDTLKDLLRQAAGRVPCEAFLAVPEMEAIFFQDRSTLERIVAREVTDELWEAGNDRPKEVLGRLFNPDWDRLIHALDDDATKVLKNHPLIRHLSEFLTLTKAAATSSP